MSKINRVEIHEFSFDTDNLGLEQATTGVGNMAYVAGDKLKMLRYAINRKTDDGLQGEYVTHWGGTLSSMAQSRMLAPYSLGGIRKNVKLSTAIITLNTSGAI